MIPKRPEVFPEAPPGMRAWNLRYIDEKIAHEHAVAKRAVEALRKVTNHAEYSPYFDNATVDNGCQCAAHLALREIEQSGWTP